MHKKEQESSFVSYNSTIAMLKMCNMQYNRDTKELCELNVFNILSNIHSDKEVYNNVLSYMQKNELYERYFKAILELDFSSQNVKKEKSSDLNDKDRKEKHGKDNSVATKKRKDINKNINELFIRNLFKDDDED